MKSLDDWKMFLFSIYAKCDSFDKAEICILSNRVETCICLGSFFMYVSMEGDDIITSFVKYRYNQCSTIIKTSDDNHNN